MSSTTVLDHSAPDILRLRVEQSAKRSSASGTAFEPTAEDLRASPRAGRTVPMGVLNLGMPRTGTMSMQHALNILGYSCYHSSVFFRRTGDMALWNDAQDAKFFGKGSPYTREDWDNLLGGYSAVSADPPAVAFAEDLVAVYPEAKVILVEREVEAWLASFKKTVTAAMWSPYMHRIADWDPWFVGKIRDTHLRWAQGWFGANSQKEMDENSRKVYADHYALLRRVTPKERLLEYELGSGWGPLCEFLGKEVPDCEFPRANDSDALWEQLVLVTRRGVKNAGFRLAQFGGVALVVSAVGFWAWTRM